MNALKNISLTMGFILAAGSVLGQSTSERHVWQDARYFGPYSRTATAITGPIKLSGNPEFATAGSRMILQFANGTSVELISEGASYRSWNYASDGKQTAEVFRAASPPDELLNGNRICGGPPSDLPIYFVFHESRSYSNSLLLNLAVFQSDSVPVDINSEGLCGTFSYDVETPT